MFKTDSILIALQEALSEYNGRSWYDILEKDVEMKRIRNEPTVWSDEWTIRIIKKLKVCYDDE